MAKDNKKTNIHKGHRKRMLARYIDKGIDAFQEHEVIEMLLYLAYPRGDMNPKAHMLLKKFGSLDNLLDASHEELLINTDDDADADENEIGSLTQRAAYVISFIRDMDKYAKTVAAKNTLRSTVLTDVYEVGRFCCTHFGNNPIEVLNMIVLDSSSKVKNIIKVSEGNVRSTSASLEKVLMLAIKHKACGVILCHNHPGGNLEISNADKTMTDKIAASLRTLDIPLVDHIICCDDKFESMRQRCMILY